MEELTIDSPSLVVTLNSDSLIPNNTFVLSGDNSNLFTSSDPSSDPNSYITLPLQLIQNIDLNSTSQNVLLKNFANNTVLIDSSQLALLSNQLIIGNQVGTSVAFQQQNEKSLDIDPITYGLNIEEIDFEEINPTLKNNGNNQENETLRDKESISNDVNDANFKENTEENFEKTKDLEKSLRDPSIQPPIGKGPFKCRICFKEFIKWNHYNKHMKFHLDDKPFSCTKCSCSFNIKANLILHEATHNSEDLRCPECNRKFTRKAGLKAHIMLHQRDETVFCGECGDEFVTLAQLEEHKFQHSEEIIRTGIYECKECLLQFKKASDLRDHMKEHYKFKASLCHKSHKKNIDRSNFVHKCYTCSKTFQKPSQLLRHIRIHTGERPFKCNLCDRAFNQKGSLQIHMSKHNGNRPYKCEFCAAAFSQKGNLRAHIVRVHPIPFKGEETFKCSECPCVFKKLGTLNAHLSRMHRGENKIMAIDESLDPNKYFQFHVDAVMRGLAELENAASFSKEDNFSQNNPVSNLTEEVDGNILEQAIANAQCLDTKEILVNLPNNEVKNKPKEKENKNDQTSIITLVDKFLDGSARKYVIRQRRVGKLRWHQCSFCTKEFKKPSDLVRHIRIHTREKPFKCNYCFRHFAVKSTLTSHIRTHTGVKQHICQICGKGLSSSGSLKLHLRTHNDLFPFECGECGKNFRKENLLKIHKQTHKDESTNDSENNSKRIRKKALDIKTVDKVVLEEPLVITDNGLVLPLPRNSLLLRPEQSGINRPFKCNVCLATFLKISHLKQHILMHTGERPFPCPHCQKRFISKGVLKCHLSTHTATRAYKCLDCRKEFTTMGSLKRHRDSHSDKRPYLCPYCAKTFKSAVACRKHMKIHRYELALRQTKPTEDSLENQTEQIPVVEDSNNPYLDITPELAQVLVDNGFHVSREISGEKIDDLQVSAETAQEIEQVDFNTAEHIPAITVEEHIPGVIPSVVPSETNLNLNTFSTEPNLPEFSGTLLESQTISENNNETIEDSSETDPSSRLPVKLDLNNRVELTQESSNPSVYEHSCFDSTVFSMTIPSDQLDIEGLSNSTSGISTILSQATTTNPNTEILEDLPVSPNNINLEGMVEVTISEPIENSVMQLFQQINNSETESICTKSLTEIKSEKFQNKPLGNSFLPNKSKVCHVCNRRFKKLCHLKVHLRSHTGEKPYACSLCNMRLTTNSSYKLHLKTHYGEKDYSCFICDNKFTTKASLQKHMSIHNRSHVRRQLKLHDQKLRKIRGDTSEKKRRPPIIRLTEKETDALAQKPPDQAQSISEKVLLASVAEKDRISIKEDPSSKFNMEPLHAHQCKYCPKSFRKPSDLVRHIRIHTGERPYQCEFCLKSFTVKSTLDCHIKTHSGTKHFPCHVCGSLFSTKGSLKVHMRLHTGAKPFKCSQCEMRFRTSGHRKAHQLTHIKLSQGQKHARKRKLQLLEESQNQDQIQVLQGEQEQILETKDSMDSQNENVTFNTNPIDEQETEQLLEQTMLIPLTINATNEALRNDNGETSTLQLQLTDLNNTSGPTTYMPLHIDENLLQQFQANNIILQPTECEVQSDLIRFEIQECQPQMIFTPIETLPVPVTNECNFCGKQFNKASQLERHIPTHTGEKPFKCTECSKSYSQKTTLKIHMLSHTGERPHSCPHCSMKFSQKAYLNGHIKRIHTKDGNLGRSLLKSNQIIINESTNQEN